MKCPICNTRNDDGSEVCSRCGASLTEQKTEEQYFKKRYTSKSSMLTVLSILLILFLGRMLILFGAGLIKNAAGNGVSAPFHDVATERTESAEWQQTKEDIERQIEPVSMQEIKENLERVIENNTGQMTSGTDHKELQITDLNSTVVGMRKNDVYENSVLGYGCKLEDWRFFSDEEIAEANGYKDNLPEDVLQLIENSGFVIVMAAQSNTMDQEVNINICDMKSQYGGVFTQEELEHMLPSLISGLKTNYEKMGFSNVSAEVVDIDFAGDTYKGMLVTSEVSGVPVYQKQLALCIGDYCGVITASSFIWDMTDQVFTKFYPMK